MSNILPTADMATADRIDYSSIKGVVISFSNDLLDASAGDLAPKFDDFFDATNVVLDPDLLQIAVDQTESLLSWCKGDTTRLSSILNKIYFKRFSLDANKTVNLQTQAAFEAAFDEAVRRQEDHVSLIAVVSNLKFHPDFHGNNLDLIFTSRAAMLSVPTLDTLLAMQSLAPSPPTGPTAKSVGSSAAITKPTRPPANDSIACEPPALGSRLCPSVDAVFKVEDKDNGVRHLIPSESLDLSARLSSEADDGIIHLIQSEPRRIGSRHLISSVDCYVPAFFGLDDDQGLNVMSATLIPSAPPELGSRLCPSVDAVFKVEDKDNGTSDLIPSQLGRLGSRLSSEADDGVIHLIQSEPRRIGSRHLISSVNCYMCRPSLASMMITDSM